ncbi:MAG: cell division ATP-binding protein FtsE [Candidatus Poribacteria bacterium]
MAIIEVAIMDDVSIKYKKDVFILQDISISIDNGEFVFLVGPCGAGKSTILRLLHREITPTSGSINVAGYNLTKMKTSELPNYRRKVGFVFQDFKLLPNRTVAQNVALTLRVAGARGSHIRRSVDRVLAWTGLTHRRDALPEDISGGEQQRTAIARAIVNDPLILLADEPTGNLDPELSIEIMSLFERYNKRGATVVVATHDVDLAQRFNKRIVIIHQGKIIKG